MSSGKERVLHNRITAKQVFGCGRKKRGIFAESQVDKLPARLNRIGNQMSHEHETITNLVISIEKN